ncbi:MAG TPA: hypothetical protein VIY86_03090, partial [Pirellulaceae bacterium]
MSGPMNWFRKRQKLLLGVFGVALMIVFTISMGGGTDPLVDMLSGNWNGSDGRGEMVVRWREGKLFQDDLENLRRNRRIVSQYVALLMRQAIEKGGEPRRFGIDSRYSDDALLETQLLSSEAKKHGIAVSDEEILEFLGDLTDDRLQQSDFAATWKNITGGRLTNIQLFELLRREIAAQRMISIIRVAAWPTSPVRTWDLFNRIERKVKVEMMPLKVDDYVQKVSEPSEAELKVFFDDHKQYYASPDSPQPGFKQRERRAFQCVRFDFKEFLDAEAALVTEAEIKKYYDDNL